jgi:hypothetical protein
MLYADSLFSAISSKSLLLQYCKSETVVRTLGQENSVNLVSFLRNNFFLHEQSYARHNFLYCRAFDSYSNTCLEGTNNALKHCENGVRPDMLQAKATKVMTNQAKEKESITKKAVAGSFFKTKLYTGTPTSTHLQQVAESMMQVQMKEVENYASLRVNESTWWVIRSATAKANSNRIIPLFRRLRIVKVDHNGKMTCSCGYTDRHGIPDRHVAHVAVKYGQNFSSFSHHDVDIRFHTNYCKFVATDDPTQMNEASLKIRSQLQEVRRTTCGFPNAPSFQGIERVAYAVGNNSAEEFHRMDLEGAKIYFEGRHKSETVVVNYSLEDVQMALRAANEDGNAAGMTQEKYNCEDSDETEDGIDFPDCDMDTDNNDTNLSFYEQVNPVWKEMAQVFDRASQPQIDEVLSKMEELINMGKRFLAAEVPRPKGSIVSCMPPNRRAPTKHKKQLPYHR